MSLALFFVSWGGGLHKLTWSPASLLCTKLASPRLMRLLRVLRLMQGMREAKAALVGGSVPVQVSRCAATEAGWGGPAGLRRALSPAGAHTIDSHYLWPAWHLVHQVAS